MSAHIRLDKTTKATNNVRMSALGWVLMILAVAAAMGCGFLLGRLWASDAQRIQQLEQELADAQSALTDYRSEVNGHFDRTAELFAQLTGSYRDFYRHLADGYDRLTSVPSRRLLPESSEPLLAEAHEPPPQPHQGQTPNFIPVAPPRDYAEGDDDENDRSPATVDAQQPEHEPVPPTEPAPHPVLEPVEHQPEPDRIEANRDLWSDPFWGGEPDATKRTESSSQDALPHADHTPESESDWTVELEPTRTASTTADEAATAEEPPTESEPSQNDGPQGDGLRLENPEPLPPRQRRDDLF